MAWVVLVCLLDACRAVVPVRAVHALVTDAVDVLPSSVYRLFKITTLTYFVTPIADSPVTHVTSRSTESGGQDVEGRIF